MPRMKQPTRVRLPLLILLLWAVTAPILRAGTILLIHGHADDASLWSFQGPALELASRGSRVFDPGSYRAGERPEGGFQANGIYAVSYYQLGLAPGGFEPPISPVMIGGTEIPVDEPSLRPLLGASTESLASRLARIIRTVHQDTGQKVILVCHSMGGLVAEAAIAYFGCHEQVEKLVTLGSPLGGFPADFRVPTEIVANQSQRGFRYVRESLQMSEGVTYGGISLSGHLEDRFKVLRTNGITAVCIVGTLSPFPESLLGGPSDGVVRTSDAQFRDPRIARVYPLPLAHMERMSGVWLAPEDSLCRSPRSTQILEKEVLGIDPEDRLSVHVGFQFGTGRIRIRLRNDGGLPADLLGLSARYELLDPASGALVRGSTVTLGGAAGSGLLPEESQAFDGPALERGERVHVRVRLVRAGRELGAGSEASYVANIQAPELEASVRYDFVNSVLHNEWDSKGGSQMQGVPWGMRYRFEGEAQYDPGSNRLRGMVSGRIFADPPAEGGSDAGTVIFAESYPFEFDVGTSTFLALGHGTLGKTSFTVADAAFSHFRGILRAALLPLVNQPGRFVAEDRFSAVAGVRLERPVFQYDPSNEGLGLSLRARLALTFDGGSGRQTLAIPLEVECSTQFAYDERGIVLKPCVRRLSALGMALGESHRRILQSVVEANELVVAPARLGAGIERAMRDSLEEVLGEGSVPESQRFFDDTQLGVEVGPDHIRILVDLLDDARRSGANVSADVPDNGILIQERLVNHALDSAVRIANESLKASGKSTVKIGRGIKVPGTSAYFDVPVLGPISIGAGFDGVRWYFDRVRFTVGRGSTPVLPPWLGDLEDLDPEDLARRLRVRFAGPDDRVEVSLPIDAKFYNQLRFYFAVRVGVSIPFAGFVGYTKRWEEKSLRKQVNETLAVDVEANLYPFFRETRTSWTNVETGEISVDASQSVGVRFPPKEIDIDTNFQASKGFLIPILGELVMDPLVNLAIDRPELLGPVGAVVGGTLGVFAPELLDAATDDDRTSASKELFQGTDSFGDAAAVREMGLSASDLERLGMGEPNTYSGIAGPGLRPVLGTIGFVGGLIGGSMLGDYLEEKLQPIEVTKSVTLPARIQLTDLAVQRRAASLSVDVEPGYGELQVLGISGLNQTNGLVALTPDEISFGSASGIGGNLVYVGAGVRRDVSALWIRKPVNRVRVWFQYQAVYANRYNQAAHRGYALRHRTLGAAGLSVPPDYAYDPVRDQVTFHLDLALQEGRTSVEELQLKVPGLKVQCVPFLLGRDTAPMLVSSPFAAYSGVSSNLTVSASTFVNRAPETEEPRIGIEQLQILRLDGSGGLLDLLPAGAVRHRALTPAETRSPRLYGAQFSWDGRLPEADFPEGPYAVLVSLRDASQDRRGSILIPFILDRTPPTLNVRLAPGAMPVVSRHKSLPLQWRVDDRWSAVVREVGMDYWGEGQPSRPGAAFTTGGEALVPGSRRFLFQPDLSLVPDDFEQSFHLEFHAQDVPGNRGKSDPLPFRIDTRPPSLSGITLLPTGKAPHHAVLSQSNRILTVKLDSHEPFTARFTLGKVDGGTNEWVAESSPVPAISGQHRAVWILELPEGDPDQGLLDGVVGDGVHALSIDLVDAGRNTNSFPNFRSIRVDRRAPLASFRTQETFVPAAQGTFPLDLDTSRFEAGDRVSSIALVNLNGSNPSSAPEMVRSWSSGPEISGLLSNGIPLDPATLGRSLEAGYYGVEVRAQDEAGNETRITTQFGYRSLRPHVEVQGHPAVTGIVPIIGIALDPDPTDRFRFQSRELYWAAGAGVPIPADPGAADPGVWKTSGIYTLPPRGTAFAQQPNRSAQMVSQGILGYWNTTVAAVAFDGEAQASLAPGGIVVGDVTLMMVVRDEGGRAWAHTTTCRVDNRSLDLARLTSPGVSLVEPTVQNRELQLEAALFGDAPVVQVVVQDAAGNAVYREVRSAVESRNGLLGSPRYSALDDFGFFVWFDETAAELRVRCVSPQRDSAGRPLSRGHTFRFSVTGGFGTNGLTFHQLAPGEIPEGSQIHTDSSGNSRAIFALAVPPGTEKGVGIPYAGGSIDFNALAIDDYVEVLYENGARVDKLLWRADDAGSVFTNALAISPTVNASGFDGLVMLGRNPEPADARATANHSGVLGHVFLGRNRSEPISPMRVRLDSASVRPDVAFSWDLRRPDGGLADPGNYEVLVFAIDDQIGRFHGARRTFRLTRADVPFQVSSLRFEGEPVLNPVGDGGFTLRFNTTRSAVGTVRVLDEAARVVATLVEGQPVLGRMDTNAPHRIWWDGLIGGAPAPAGRYSFELTFQVDGETRTQRSDSFAVRYPANAPKESDWGLLTQPIAFDPATRDRIVRGLDGIADNDRAWVTLRFDATLSDGSREQRETQVELKEQESSFASVVTDTNTDTHIGLSALFPDAVQKLERVQVRFNDRVVDVFPGMPIETGMQTNSRTGQFQFTIQESGVRAFRLKVKLAVRLKPWRDGLLPIFTEDNRLFDPEEIREFARDLEFREVPGSPGLVRSEPWKLDRVERLWGLENVQGASFARHGWAELMEPVVGLEVFDRTGRQLLGRFNPVQIRDGGSSTVDALFRIFDIENRKPAEAIGLDLILEANLADLLAEAAEKRVPITPGFVGINGVLEIPDSKAIVDDLDPFPTRHYHPGGTLPHDGQKYDNVKAYSGDSGLIEEVEFTGNKMAGHALFDYSLRPFSEGARGRQTFEVHPWIPWAFRKPAGRTWDNAGRAASAWNGFSVASGSLPDGRGFSGFIVGAPQRDDSGGDGGQIFVFRNSRFGGISQDFTERGVNLGRQLGWSVGMAGDVNGDGLWDIVAGAPNDIGTVPGGSGTTRTGSIRIYYGTRSGWTTSGRTLITGSQAFGSFGHAVAGVGDVNGDGFDDVIVGAPREESDSGQGDEGHAYVYHGSASGLRPTHAWLEQPNVATSRFGQAVAGLGDIDGDGYDDVAVGASQLSNGETGEGRVYVYHGSAQGLPTRPRWTDEPHERFANFGNAVAGVGDLNRDGFADMVVGASGYSKALTGQGCLFVYLGSTNGFNQENQIIPGDAVGLQLGYSVAAAGDVNADGFPDIVVGCADGGKGAVRVYLGSASGLVTEPYWSQSGQGADDRFGSAVGGGDVDGDGYADVLIGAYRRDAGATDSGEVQVRFFPQAALIYKGWARGGSGDVRQVGVLPKVPVSGLQNLNPVPLVNVGFDGKPNQVGVSLNYDGDGRSNRVQVTYSSGRSGYVTNAPFPLLASEAPGWVFSAFMDASGMAAVPVPVDPANGQTNVGWQLGLRFAAITNDLILAASPDAYDTRVSDGVIDFEGLMEDDPSYDPTVNYFSVESAWNLVARSLPGYPAFAGVPAIRTFEAERPRIALTNIAVRHDPRFPAIVPADLKLGFTRDAGAEASDNAFVRSSFSHRESGFFREWHLAEDPNLQAAAVIPPEVVRVKVDLEAYAYRTTGPSRTNSTVRNLLDDAALELVDGLATVRRTRGHHEDAPSFAGFSHASVTVQVVHRTQLGSGEEVETVKLVRVDLSDTARVYRVRSSRYRMDVTPVLSGDARRDLAFEIAVRLDPPTEYSVRQPLRRGDRITLPMQVIDRERFWQVDSGERVGNLFRTVAIEGQGRTYPEPAYWIDSMVGYTQTNGSKPRLGDPDYQRKADAFFWKTYRGTVVKNPRLVLGPMSVHLKDPSGREDSPAFEGRRYVQSITNEFFHDLYAETNEGPGLSWTARIRPQAKEHAYVKVYGSVGGSWKLSYRPRGDGRSSGFLPLDAGTPAWTVIETGEGYGQNQFLAYWDITELNGPHILRLESAASPDHAPDGAEVKFLEVMLGQHLPGRNNPVFSPGGVAERASLFSMHGRTQLVSAPTNRAPEDLFFTVNPMKIDERPFSLGTNGTIPLGERVQILPHTDHNPLSVNFYIDRQEFELYDRFSLFHQLESGELDEIVSLPPLDRGRYTLIQGFVRHTSDVGFLPAPSLRKVDLAIPRASDDGRIRIAGSIPLHARDERGNLNEDLTVAIVVSPVDDFYGGQVRARLSTGPLADFPVASESASASLDTGWTSADPIRTNYVFAVVVDPRDDWLVPGRFLSAADANQHLFNVSRAQVVMTSDVHRSLVVVGNPVLSPNGDGIGETVRLDADFGRSGATDLELLNELGERVHVLPIILDESGRGTIEWDGRINGQGTLRIASDGIYTATARFHDGGGDFETASTKLEVRSRSRYGGRLEWVETRRQPDNWQVVLLHEGEGIASNDEAVLQISDVPNFSVLRGARPLSRSELSARLEVDLGSLDSAPADAAGNVGVHLRVRVTDAVGNVQTSVPLHLTIPAGRRLQLSSVTPAPAATQVLPDPDVVISLMAPSPFTEAELDRMFQWWPAVPRTVRLSADGRILRVHPSISLPPGSNMVAILALRDGVSLSGPDQPAGPDLYRWTFTVVPRDAVNWTFQARLADGPLQLDGATGRGTLVVQATATGIGVPRLRVEPGVPVPNVLRVAAPSEFLPLVRAPDSTILPLTVETTNVWDGLVLVPLLIRELNSGATTTLVASVALPRAPTRPSLRVTEPQPGAGGPFAMAFRGRSIGEGTVSTLARVNGGAWWQVGGSSDWSFEVGFAAGNDVLEIVARDASGQTSAAYRYIFPPPALLLSAIDGRTLSWDAQLGKVYSVEWSTDLDRWDPLPGSARDSGSSVLVVPGNIPVRIADVPVGRVSVRLDVAHPVLLGERTFFRVSEAP